VNDNDVSRWFGEYPDEFAACGRGEGKPASLPAYGVPLLLATDDGFVALTSEDRVVAVVKQQIDGCERPITTTATSSTPTSRC
jgi:hypothetical protein